ncbi:MAG: DUF84 family protein [Candidatus Woesearchaeota archaeon]
MKIVIGSKNQAKNEAAKHVFNTYLPNFKHNYISVSTDSKVKSQPLTLDEGLEGAKNRALESLEYDGASLGVGLEGTVHTLKTGMYLIGCAAITDKNKKIYYGTSAGVFIPEDIKSEIDKGKELGPVMLEITKNENLRNKGGANSIFTNNLYTRKDEFKDALIAALGSYLYTNKKNN